METSAQAQALLPIQTFLEDVQRAETFYSCLILTFPVMLTAPLISEQLRYLQVALERRPMRELKNCVCPSTSQQDQYIQTFPGEGALLPVIQTLVACPTWAHAQFIFRHHLHSVPVLGDVVLGLFPLLSSSRSLSILDLQFWGSDVCYFPSLEFAKSIAQYLSQNSVLKSLTLTLYYWEWDLYPLLLRPFTSSSETEANVVLKELVIQTTRWSSASVPGEEAIVNLVRSNTTLEKLELSWAFLRFMSEDPTFFSDTRCKSIAAALEVNCTLKESGCVCNEAGLKEFIRVLVPDIVSGHQPNTSLSTLTLYPATNCCGRDFMDLLARMLESNTTLKHVQVSAEHGKPIWMTWDDMKFNDARYVECKTRDKLESMMSKELKLNSSLQALVVGTLEAT